MWVYSQSSGMLSHDGEPIATGYSGHSGGFNNPDMQDTHDVGPLPQGYYDIQPMVDSPHVGPCAMPLHPHPDNKMFGRFAFFIHGDTMAMNYTASNGCIVLDRHVRLIIANSQDNQLTVEP